MIFDPNQFLRIRFKFIKIDFEMEKFVSLLELITCDLIYFNYFNVNKFTSWNNFINNWTDKWWEKMRKLTISVAILKFLSPNYNNWLWKKKPILFGGFWKKNKNPNIVYRNFFHKKSTVHFAQEIKEQKLRKICQNNNVIFFPTDKHFQNCWTSLST